MKLDDVMKELIQHKEDLELLTTDDQLYKAEQTWDRLLVLILELKEQNYSFKVIVPRLQSIGLEDIAAEYLEYNRPSLQVFIYCNNNGLLFMTKLINMCCVDRSNGVYYSVFEYGIL
ncbi:hypothetical protein BATDEDRAFT_92988 [Batrachochytrium dendrobatidis JAM81]|uniref:Uncharacterized protein n=1 Tax=Batrachochytrium dendrobatidis (strain JAM81 / FGSC 10211) TaxID=684364 RepID=F4PF42_BATDJ|nr:uncharacterized protein BATDEDRAFT_92988 [Batrachochytrium dendrobatidis JAM81]EGF76154.1 hypothetical protein BATDEDRAFT_92988 [Batrachochytrium dendrobatidis JAM81]|eukprot:XP_006683225.1 hypothetical protein BATDEDRAFT_92988 [Batrachochytrium dendrobatidis JAM81]